MSVKSNRRVRGPFGDYHLDMEDLMGQLFGGRINPTDTGWRPAVSITENEKGYGLTFELPGVSPEDVEVEMVEGVLHVSGKKQAEELEEGTTYLRNDRLQGEFKRSFEFPKAIDADHISAEFRNGLLNITVPKSEKEMPKKIEIKSS